ncbi:mitochondrial inner membrane m-AAA protease component paraplegin [Hydra vulgaris]|uniref:mitochondrial inner membrane m-AAA protease component paraplegin n=1 Tax=Hydra vulgaris TaxID=6087 RepID=UPI001F5EBE3F|nr:paraplegin [Hydra vulgaris]XP_047140194.1 paraplegin [Hydra vulgaris]XP_047140243.1 paraplegin [Hydra vulgaris]
MQLRAGLCNKFQLKTTAIYRPLIRYLPSLCAKASPTLSLLEKHTTEVKIQHRKINKYIAGAKSSLFKKFFYWDQNALIKVPSWLLSVGPSNKKSNNSFKENEGNENPDGKNQENNPYNGPNFFLWAIGFFLISVLLKNGGNGGIPETSWPVFLRLMLQTGEVDRLTVSSNQDQVYVFLKEGAQINGREVSSSGPDYKFSIGNLQRFEENLIAEQKKLGIESPDYIPVSYSSSNKSKFSLLEIMMIGGAALAFIFYFISNKTKGGLGFGSFGNPFLRHTVAKATIIKPGSKQGISFKKVAGMNEAKQEVMEFVDFLKNADKFKELGAKMPKGALLCGPPGTGKTLLAKAIATESSVPFLSMAGSDFVEMFSGVGAARVRDLFSQARKMSPCIVYVDEIDAIGRARRPGQGGNSEQESTLNQLLVEMDGINSGEGVVMLASTNRPDILDQALMRPGRFDRTITIDLPTLVERKDIFEIYLSDLKLGSSLTKYSERLAELTPGKSGADIANICNEAALHAARLNEKCVDSANFEYAVERVIAGIQKRTNTMSDIERRIVAYHEAGHAIVNWMLKYTEPVLKISIIPRTSSPFGYTQKFPLDIKLHTNEQLFDMMCGHLGGRAAEAITFGRITTGAEDDLKLVTKMAYQQIVTFGMNERIGPISFRMKNSEEISRKPYSDALARIIDEEARSLVSKALDVTNKVITENKIKLDKLASELLEKEVINHDTLIQIIGPPPFGDKRETYYKKAFQST